MISALALLAALLYGVATAQTLRAAPRSAPLAAAAVALHGLALVLLIFQPEGLALGVRETLALFTWQSALLLLLLGLRLPVSILGLGLYPLAGFALLVAAFWPSTQPLAAVMGWRERVHILLALLAAGLLTLAALQALALAVQERRLHEHRQPQTLALPPLLVMERLLFQLIAVGFGLLSAVLLSGLWFVQDWFTQHLVHKTVLSITAWLIFGMLLWGRQAYGWRGQSAIRWTLSGYGVLILAYFGSKLILEEILGRHWS